MVTTKRIVDLSKYKEIAIDLETRDPDLKKKGSGSVIVMEIVGIAVAVDGWKGYYPIAHGEGPNMDKQKVSNGLQMFAHTFYKNIS